MLVPYENDGYWLPKDVRVVSKFCNIMHEAFVDIKMEQNYGLHHDGDFGGTHLVDVDGHHSPHQTPQHEYEDFGFPTSTNAQMDPIYSRPMQSSFSSPQPLHPLDTMPQWPSQITNPSENSPPAVVPLHRPILPLSKTMPLPTISTSVASSKSHSSSTSRRTLTDSDRRRMCEYHNDNPNVKQTEIGGMFMTSSVRENC